MRNLVEFPVTPDEVLEHLARARDEMAKTGGIGDMHPMIIDAVIQLLEADRTALQRVVERLRI